jgi:hypothetical protein
MTTRILAAIFAAGALTALLAQHQKPDLSGIWQYSVATAGGGVRQVVQGQTIIGVPDQSGRQPAKVPVPGALPGQPAPNFKPEMLAAVKEADENQTSRDNTFACGKPGVPRIGPPRKIVQLPTEVIFFYEDMSGDQYRIIPFDAKHREDADPSFNGDSIAWWEGDTLVVEAVNFVTDTWFGEYGYIHSDAMKVTERLWKVGENLAYQVIVEDPKVLAEPWVQPVRLIKPSDEPLTESPPCIEDDFHRLTNKDHHLQR